MTDKKKLQYRVEETLEGAVVFNVPMPEDLAALKKMTPIVIKYPYHIDYIHSYGQDSPFFAGLTNKKHLGTRCPTCDYGYATPKAHCMYCGSETDWVELPEEGKVHCFTVCHFGSEAFLDETPYTLALVEFEGMNTLFLTRLLGVDMEEPGLDWVGMKVKRRFLRNSRLKPTDVYYLPADQAK